MLTSLLNRNDEKKYFDNKVRALNDLISLYLFDYVLPIRQKLNVCYVFYYSAHGLFYIYVDLMMKSIQLFVTRHCSLSLYTHDQIQSIGSDVYLFRLSHFVFCTIRLILNNYSNVCLIEELAVVVALFFWFIWNAVNAWVKISVMHINWMDFSSVGLKQRLSVIFHNDTTQKKRRWLTSLYWFSSRFIHFFFYFGIWLNSSINWFESLCVCAIVVVSIPFISFKNDTNFNHKKRINVQFHS